MSLVRICPKCSWVHPQSFSKARCRVCSTILPTQFCTYCKNWLPTDLFTFQSNGTLRSGCKQCKADNAVKYVAEDPAREAARKADWHRRRREAAELKYNEWLADTANVFKPLTEDKWLETCRYFNGCAICGEPHIESRQFFVKFEEGGRYTAWNMFPMCAPCAHRPRSTTNPFEWLNNQNATRLGMSLERKERLLEYLTLKIEEM